MSPGPGPDDPERGIRARVAAIYADRKRARRSRGLAEQVLPESTLRAVARWRGEHRTGYRTHKLVNQGLRIGKLVRPDACQGCGRSGARLHGHHDDYAKPLDVRWLCGSCHRLTHIRMRAAGG